MNTKFQSNTREDSDEDDRALSEHAGLIGGVASILQNAQHPVSVTSIRS